MRKLIDIPMLIERTPESMGEGIVEMLQGINNDKDDFNDPSKYLTNELRLITLDWMGAGEVGKLNTLLGSIRKALEHSTNVHCSDKLTPNECLTITLQNFGDFICTYLGTNNLAKDLARLNDNDRKVLLSMYDYAPIHGVKYGEIIMNRLTNFGLVEQNEGLYDLTWAGRSVARHLEGKS